MGAIRRKIKRTSRSADDSGSAALELGLIAPILVLLLAGVVEVGHGAYEAMQAQSAVEAGMTYAANNDWDAIAIANAVVGASGASNLTADPAPTQFCGCPDAAGITTVSCSATCASGQSPGSYVQINAAIKHTVILSLLSMPSSFNATAIVRK
jgi:Flp pilus assembly protein TadG